VPLAQRSKSFIISSETQKSKQAQNLLVSYELYWALFYIPLWVFTHLLTVLVHISNKMELQKKKKNFRKNAPPIGPWALLTLLWLYHINFTFINSNSISSAIPDTLIDLLLRNRNVHSASKWALQLWELVFIYSESMYSVLNCHNVAKHTKFYLG
jgi:hypothetical protein